MILLHTWNILFLHLYCIQLLATIILVRHWRISMFKKLDDYLAYFHLAWVFPESCLSKGNVVNKLYAANNCLQLKGDISFDSFGLTCSSKNYLFCILSWTFIFMKSCFLFQQKHHYVVQLVLNQKVWAITTLKLMIKYCCLNAWNFTCVISIESWLICFSNAVWLY